MNDDQYARLIRLIEDMAFEVKERKLDIEISRNIDDFWYLQKAAELKLLNEQLEALTARAEELRKLMDRVYAETGSRYKSDYSWLMNHLNHFC